MGVFGMLAIALTVFVLHQVTSPARWPGIERYIKVAIWGSNIGLLMMLALSLFPAGVLQVWDVLQNGYWHARSHEFIASKQDRKRGGEGKRVEVRVEHGGGGIIKKKTIRKI